MNRCKLKYPILMVHGTGFRDNKILNYWGRIPRALEEEGAEVYYGKQDSWGNVDENAEVLKKRILSILQKKGVEKVNIIAHSKGGLEARYLVSSLDMGNSVASITTIATPHHGSKTLDIFGKLPRFIQVLISWIVNIWFRILGDRNPDFLKSVKQMNTKNMKEFNQKNTDCEGIIYRSYGFKMKNAFSDLFLFWNYVIIYLFEGPNDGVVSTKSSEWSNYKGPFTGPKQRGISHLDEVDFRRMNINRKKIENKITDIRDFYVAIIEELKEKGC